MKYTEFDEDNNRFVQVEEPDASANYTYADYLKWKFEERVELFRGRILRLAAPNTKHQQIVGSVFVTLANYLKGKKCQAFVAPFDIRLPVKNKKKDDEITTVVQPDVCVVCDDSKIDTKGVCGAPDLVIEVLSPGNSVKELSLKYELYEEAGVKEYWIIYPEEESTAVFTLNENGKYDGAKLYAGNKIIKSTAVPGLIVDSIDIFTT